MSISQVRFGSGCFSSNVKSQEQPPKSTKQAMKVLRQNTAKLEKQFQSGRPLNMTEIERTVSRLEGSTSALAKKSEQKAAKQEKKLKEQLDIADKARDRFIATNIGSVDGDAVNQLMRQVTDEVTSTKKK